MTANPEAPTNVKSRAIWGSIIVAMAVIAFAAHEYMGAALWIAFVAFAVGVAMLLPSLIVGAAKLVKSAKR